MLEQFIAFCESLGETEIDMWNVRACALAQFGQSLYPHCTISAGATSFVVIEAGKTVEVIPWRHHGVMSLTEGHRRNDTYITGSALAALLRKEFTDVL